MNPIMEGLNKEPLEGIASLAPTQPTQPPPTQPSQPLDPQMTPPPGGIQPIPVDPSNPVLGGVQTPPGSFPVPEVPGAIGKGLLGEPITPYVRNENLDLTNRGSIMDEYNKYIQGGMGSSAHTMDVSGGFSFMGEDLAPGSSTGFGDFRKFLDTYGIGDRLQFDNTGISKVGGPDQSGIASLADYQSQQNTGPGI